MQDRKFHHFIIITIIVPLEHDSVIRRDRALMKSQPFHSANANNAASGNSPAYNLLANASRRSRRVRLRGSEDSMIALAVSNIEEAILMRRSGVMSL